MSDHFIQTFTGKKVNPMKLTIGDICIEDIAHALALTNRFTGHTPQPYSVAQHSCLVHDLCPEPCKLWGLVHDGPEAYFADISRPVKMAVNAQYGNMLKKIDGDIMCVICGKFDLEYVEPKEVKLADEDALANEAFAFFGNTEAYKSWHHQFSNGYNRLPFVIYPWDWKVAEQAFLERFYSIMKGREMTKKTDAAVDWQNAACDESGLYTSAVPEASWDVIDSAAIPTKTMQKIDPYNRAIVPEYAVPNSPISKGEAAQMFSAFITKDSGQRSVFATGAQRDTAEGKGRYDLIPTLPLRRLAQLYERGAKKYGDNNWRKGIPLPRYVDSAKRHLDQWVDGDRTEDHLAAVLFNTCGLMWTENEINEGRLPGSLVKGEGDASKKDK